MNLKNDNEFENLFRRAADNFPLNTSGSNWESVLAKLEEKKVKRPFILINKKILIVLLCILFIVGGTSLGLFISTKSNVTTVITVSDASNIELEKNKTLANTIGAAVYKKIVDSLKKQQLIDSANNRLSHKNAANHYSNSKQALSGNRVSNNQLAYSFKNLPVKATPIKPFEKSIANYMYRDKNTTVINTLKAHTATQNIGATIAAEVVNNVKDTNNAALKNTDTATIPNNLTRNAKKKDVKTKFFYAGVMYATDKSALNFEPNRGRGYSLALVLGYQFSSVFSIETGIHIEKKEYYTTGENFNKSIIPANGKVNWIEAENKLIEIPITLKYNFYAKKQHQFFCTVGLSTYLINKEYYEYEEEIGGVLQNGSVLYEKNTSNLFATYNFSLGYQFNLKKVGNLRIEPYINLPLKGTGLGNEPVISRGIYLGWIYNFKK